MNSLLKQTTPSTQETPEHFVLEFEKRLLVIELLEAELTMTKLKFLGINFDPFNQDVTSECQQIMDNLGLTEHLKNPYLATNILLRLLDKTEERVNNLKQ
jgi:two-component sensor histidine kinase